MPLSPHTQEMMGEGRMGLPSHLRENALPAPGFPRPSFCSVAGRGGQFRSTLQAMSVPQTPAFSQAELAQARVRESLTPGRLHRG